MNYQYNPYLAQPANFAPNNQLYSYQGINNQPSNQSSQDERIWVQNQVAAESYLVAPNSFVRLWDSSKNVFYEKRADATGRPLPLEIYEYKRTTEKLVDEKEADDRFLSFEKRLNDLEVKVNEQIKSNADNSGVSEV